jgi:hypothetical protein
MKKKLICLTGLLFAPATFAQSASEYLSKVFNGSAIVDGDSQTYVKSGEVNCSTMRLNSGRYTLSFPTRSVALSIGHSGVFFACINGGGCISWKADHGLNWIFIGGFTSEVTTSISNAFAALQETCGGPEKRPF